MERKVLLYATASRVLIAVVMLTTFYSHWPGQPPAPPGYEAEQGPLNWSPLNPFLLYDGGQYVKIAEHGYSMETTVWFPLYPLMVRLLGTISSNYELAAVLVANLAFLGAALLLYKLARLDFPQRTSFAVVVAYIVFPAGAFLSSGYTESLFLLLVIGTFLAARKGHWAAAGSLGALAALTRNLGILLFPALLVEYWLQWRKGSVKGFATGLWMLLIPAGLSSYLVFLWVRFGSPFAFIQGQSSHFRSMQIPGWGLGADLFRLITETGDPLNLVIILNLLSFLLIVGSLAYIKRWSYRVYTILYLIVINSMPLTGGNMPHSTGLFRFALGVFPIYFLLGSKLAGKKSSVYIGLASLFLLLTVASLLARKLYLA